MDNLINHYKDQMAVLEREIEILQGLKSVSGNSLTYVHIMRKSLHEARVTNRQLNRRVQEAESKAYQSGGMVYKKMHEIIAENQRLRTELSMQKTLNRSFRRKSEKVG